jgi:hypothetical protein
MSSPYRQAAERQAAHVPVETPSSWRRKRHIRLFTLWFVVLIGANLIGLALDSRYLGPALVGSATYGFLLWWDGIRREYDRRHRELERTK